MASNGYILDIDTKFIQNLERADRALRQSVNAANDLTDRFTQMVNSTSNYSLGVQNVLNVLNKLKGVQIDPATGLLKMGTEARNTAEGVELLKARTEDLKERWVSLSKEVGKKKKGPAAMQIVNENDLTNINALQVAIANINDILSNASGNKKIGLKTQQQLIEQRTLYSDLLKEAQLTDAQRLESEIKLTNGVITEANKRTEAVIREKKREVTEAIKLANTANVRNLSQVFNATSAIASARRGLDPNINAEQAQIQALDMALERLNERYKAIHQTKAQTQKEIFSEAKTARDLANTARGYDEIQRAVKAIEEVMPKINPDTKRGQAEIQRLTRAYEKMYERVSKVASDSENERYQLALMSMSKTQKAQEAAKTQEEKRLKETEARITKNHADELARREADEKANYQMALVTMAARQRAQENAEKLKADNLIAMEMRITQAIIEEENKRAQIQQAHQTNANAKSSISSYVRGRNATTATESDYARMFDEQARKQAEEQYKQAMAMAQTAKSASELRNAITAIENAQKGFNKSTGDGARRLATLENAHRKLTDALAIENGELTTTQARNVSNALAYAQNAQGVMQLTIAYARLRSAAKDINPSTEAGQQALHQLELKAKDVKKQLSEISGESNKLNNTLSKVGSQLKTIFGLNAIKNFVSKLIKIHAEFEKINVSLKVLLGSSARAELIWTRITALALKSPFTIQQLTEATKQMAAYRVESNKLYSSTKMLADISAGLGVEMSRLILAYGQVKAANFLRGTELRQFSEAGIDMLGQLSAYFSEIEERAVSAAEVFDRISKRQVLFEDVDAVLHRVTDRGGAFYEMQEKQAETLSGQISNLKDSIQIMFHEIGQSTHGIIVTIVRAIRTIIENWEKWLPLIASVITGLITAKTVAIGFKVLAPIFRVVSLALASTRARTILLRNAMLALQAVTPMGWATLAVSAITSIGVAALTYSKAIDESTESTEDLENIGNAVGKIFREQADNVRELGEKILAHTIHINNLKSAQEELNEGDEAYVRNQNAIDEAISSRSALVATLTFNYSELADEIGAVLNNEKDLRDFLNGKEMHNAQQESLSKILGGITPELIEKYTSAYNGMLVDLQKNNLEWDVVDMDDLDRQAEIIAKMYDKHLKNVAAWKEKYDVEGRLSSVGMVSMETQEAYDQAKEDYNAFMGTPAGLIAPSVAEYVTYFDQIEAIALKAANEWAEINQAPIGTMTDEQVAKAISDFEEIIAYQDLGIAEAELYRRALSNVFNFEWVLPEPDLLPWQERYNNYVQMGEELLGLTVAQMEAIHREFGLIDKSNVTDAQMIEMLDSKIKEYEQIIAIAATYTDDMYGTTDTNGTTRYTRQEVENAKTGLKVAQYERGFWPATQKKGGGKKKDDYIDEAAKGIRELHKAYKDMQKTMGDGTAKEGAWERYGKGVRESLKNAKINVDSFLATVGDLTSEESVIKAFDELIKKTKDQKKKAELELAKGEFIWEIKIETDNKAFSDAMKKAEELIDGYELGVELDKLHIPHDFAQNFFDIGITELPELRLQVMAQYEGLDIGEEEQKEIEETLKKIDELETKAQQERLKKYVEFTRDAISERGKILLEEAYTLADISSAFSLTDTLAKNKGLITDEQLAVLREAKVTVADLVVMSNDSLAELGVSLRGIITPEDVERLKEYGQELASQRELAQSYAEEQADVELAKLDFESFKESEIFAQVFNDLDNASDTLIQHALDKLKEFREAWAGLDLEESSEVFKLVDKLESALSGDSARARYREGRQDIKSAMRGEGDYAIDFTAKNKDGSLVWDNDMAGASITRKDYNAYREALEAELVVRQDLVDSITDTVAQRELEYTNAIDNYSAVADSEADLLAAQQELAALQSSGTATEEQLTTAQQLVDLKTVEVQQNKEAYETGVENAKQSLDSAKDELKVAKQNRDEVAKTVAVDEQRRESLLKSKEEMGKSLELANDLYDACKGLSDVLGGEDSMVGIFADMAMQMANTIVNTIMLDIELKSATAGAMAFGTALNTAMGVIGWIVMGIQLLTMALTAAFKAHDKNVQEQIDAEVKKVEVLKNAYEDLEKQLEKASTASDIGNITREMNENLEKQIEYTEKMIALEEDKKDTDESQIESWKEDIEDMRALMEENLDEAFSSLTNGIIDDVLEASRSFVDAWYDAFDEAGDGMSGLKDTFKDMLLDMLKQQAATTLISPFIEKLQKQIYDSVMDDNIFDPEEARATKEMWDGMMPQIDESLKNYFEAFEGVLGNDGGELSDLQKGIQGMTEDQAEVLAAYWNSCRFMLANIDTNLAMIAANVLGQNQSDSPIISAIKEQTAIVKNIKEMLSGVISHDGKYINVYMP